MRLCSLIGEKVEEAALEEGDSLTLKFENDTVIALSLREEDLDGPEAGSLFGERLGYGSVGVLEAAVARAGELLRFFAALRMTGSTVTAQNGTVCLQ